MRPLKLTLAAFGPYLNTTVFELDKLGTRGLYLITGDTGAGKSTIFDGITYALFGEVSGGYRDAKMLRSTFAGPDILTEVELEFEYKGEKYRVKRNPGGYDRKAIRGDGLTAQEVVAELYMPDGTTCSKAEAVTKKIVELLGIDREQFVQIAMIAQGDFQKLLFAETGTREVIYRKIFNTAFYNKLQRELALKLNEVKSESEKYRRDSFTNIKKALCHRESVLEAELSKVKVENSLSRDKEAVLEAILHEDEERLGSLKKKMAAVEEELDEAKKIGGKKKEYEDAQRMLSVREEEKAGLEEKLDSLKKDLAAVEGNQEKCTAISQEVAVLNEKSGEYDVLDQNLLEQDRLESTVSKLRRSKDALDALNKQLEKKLNDDKEQLKNVADAGKQSVEFQNRWNECYNEKQALDKIKKAYDDYTKHSIALESAQEKLKVSLEALSARRRAYDEMNSAFLREQAGILAEGLEEDKPCPVCGSLHHPALAKKSEEAPTEEQLKEAKELSEAAQSCADELSLKAQHEKGLMEEKKENIIKDSKELLGEDVVFDDVPSLLSQRISQLIEEMNALNSQKAEAEKKEKLKLQLESSIPSQEEKLRQETEKSSRMAVEIASSETELSAVEGKIEEIRGKLQFRSKEQLLDNIKKKEAEIGRLQEQYSSCKRLVEECSSELNTKKGSVSELKKTVADLSEYENVVVEDLGVLEARKAGLEKEEQEIFHRKQTNLEVLKENEEIDKVLGDLEKKQMTVQALSETANGTLKGKEKIELETYVQMAFFDRIVERANLRFLVMSGNQYELKRKAVSSNKSLKTGLELDVVDHNSGGTRDVKTLSGGEQFMASLSLALGLADEVQEGNGGIQLDTMFVDEGFGSLDSETLDKAMKALAMLGEGNKLVGIISHVAELKDRIDSQVYVEKKNGVSSVSIRADSVVL